MKKLILLLIILSISLFTISCSGDDNATNTNSIIPKSLLVQTSRPANTYVTVEIKDNNNNILETKKDSFHSSFIFIIDKGSKFTLTMLVPNQTFAGSYQLSEDYGNIVLTQDSFTDHYNSFSATKSY